MTVHSDETLNTSEIEEADEIDRDLVCGMSVDVELARERDLLLEFADREYAFCGAECRDRFARSPARYAVAGRSTP